MGVVIALVVVALILGVLGLVARALKWLLILAVVALVAAVARVTARHGAPPSGVAATGPGSCALLRSRCTSAR